MIIMETANKLTKVNCGNIRIGQVQIKSVTKAKHKVVMYDCEGRQYL